jgi:hypothetical protein
MGEETRMAPLRKMCMETGSLGRGTRTIEAFKNDKSRVVLGHDPHPAGGQANVESSRDGRAFKGRVAGPL